MRFTEYLLVENDHGALQALADEVIDQFASENRWNYDEIMRVIKMRLGEMPEFKNQPRKMEAALAAVMNYVRA